jgi:hypothetical protein
MSEDTALARGQAVSSVLWRAWCPNSPAAIEPGALESATPLLLGGGAASLAWWRVRESPLRSTEEASRLQQAYRDQAVAALFYEEGLAKTITSLREAGLDCLVFKGWAIGRRYPDQGLRPGGDIDLLLRPGSTEAAYRVLERAEPFGIALDLHERSHDLPDRSFEALWQRAETVRLHGVEVQVFSLEDHLRLICVHLLRHGAWRPLWLCDVAVALETRPERFDWNLLFAGPRLQTGWALTALALAHRLLGAEAPHPAIRHRAASLPRWLVGTVLRQWGTPGRYLQELPRLSPLTLVRRPWLLPSDLAARWPNGIDASIRLGVALDERPRLPFQVVDFLARSAEGVAWWLRKE